MLKNQFMRKLIFIFIFLSLTKSILAQSDSLDRSDSLEKKKFGLHDVGFAIKTNVLTIMNSSISKKENEISFSGEMCFNTMHGLQLNIDYDKVFGKSYSCSDFRIDIEYIYYIENYNYSGLNVGAYFGLESVATVIGNKKYNSEYLDYRESLLEAGLSGGYQIRLKKHWIINPSVHIGISKLYSLKIFDSINKGYMHEPGGMVARTFLGVGYMF